MWCGECYISDQETLFYVKQRQEFDTKAKSDSDQEHLKRAWGSRASEACMGKQATTSK
jgi:hypothetical protein